MRPTLSIKIKKDNFKKVMRTLTMAGDKEVHVGIPEGTHRAPKAGKTSAPSMVDVAMWNEYGTDRIPARPFLRSTMDRRREDIAGLMTRATRLVVNNQMSREQALNWVGTWVVGYISKTILETYTPPNAPSTIRQKGSAHPLIDTRQLLKAVTHWITPKNSKALLPTVAEQYIEGPA